MHIRMHAHICIHRHDRIPRNYNYNSMHMYWGPDLSEVKLPNRSRLNESCIHWAVQWHAHACQHCAESSQVCCNGSEHMHIMSNWGCDPPVAYTITIITESRHEEAHCTVVQERHAEGHMHLAHLLVIIMRVCTNKCQLIIDHCLFQTCLLACDQAGPPPLGSRDKVKRRRALG